MKTFIGAAFLASSIVSSAAWAGDPEGSNIALSEYPGPTCTKPQKPVLPPPPSEGRNTVPAGNAILAQGGLVAKAGNGGEGVYNDKVEKYNKDLLAYNANIVQFNACIKTYIDNGNADLMRVQQKLNAVAAAVNSQN